MTKGVNYKVLRGCDIVLTGGIGPFSYITRCVTAGFKERHDRGIAVHIGILANWNGQLLILEMRGNKGQLVLTPISYYLNSRKRFILDIKRNDDFQNPISYTGIQTELVNDYRHGIEYDYKGLLEFVFEKIKDDPTKNICSEYIFELTKAYTNYPTKFDKKVSPYDFQKLSNFKSVKNWEIT